MSIDKEGRGCIEKALTILRLYKEDIIGYNLILGRLPKGERHDMIGSIVLPLKHYQLWISPDTRLSRRKYNITQEEVDNLRQFFAELNVETFQVIKLAVYYFNKSYIEPYSPRDSLLDLLISLESLYLKGEDRESGYKLRMRMAWLLAKELDRRNEIFEDIRKAYKYRGDIVHGERSPDIDYEFFFKIRQYARESLKMFLKEPDLRDKLDDIILKGSRLDYEY